jgi:putrescine transport system permease protein
LPILILVIYSFNDSKYVSVWQGISTKWYFSLLQDKALLNAALTSINIASISASISVCLGTIAGFILIRFPHFKGRTLFTSLLIAPFVIPEVIIGFSLLLLYIVSHKFLGWPAERNSFTVILAHATIGIAYVSFIIQARLRSIDPSLEEAAMDLGASPMQVFRVITLPIISKSLLVGWLLAFTLSFDDVIIASFTSGPSSTTLPMLIYSRIKFGISPQVNALASVLIGAVVSIILVASIINYKKQTTEI